MHIAFDLTIGMFTLVILIFAFIAVKVILEEKREIWFETVNILSLYFLSCDAYSV